MLSEASTSSSDDSDDSLAPEIWDAESDVDDVESKYSETVSQNTKSIHYVLCYFLFFQLCYRVSDGGLQHIINLLSSVLYVTCYMKRDHFGFFINIEFLAWVYSPFYVEYNGESFKTKY